MRIEASKIVCNSDGFAVIGRVHQASLLEATDGGEVVVDCSRLTFLGANMCAPLAAALAGRRARFRNVSPAIEAILAKNRFINTSELRLDTYGTTIAYRHFDPSQRDEFQEYVHAHFRGKGLPKMTVALMRRFRESLHELFENAVAHSETKLGIFACGQYFPNRNELHFCVSDRGVGIPTRVRDFLNTPISATDAIEWAMEGQNTTRLVSDGLPGGLGLKVVREFIAMNGGSIRVASNDGYWWMRGANVLTKRRLTPAFPGTTVDIEINTADTRSYALANEIDPKGIF